MKRLMIALATSAIAAASLGTTSAEAGGRLGFHFSPVFIPKPHYSGDYHRRGGWEYEDRLRRKRRLRRLRAKRRRAEHRRWLAQQRRKAIAKKKRLARIRAEKERRARLAREQADQKAAQKAAQTTALQTPTPQATTPPPLPEKRKKVVSRAPVPTEALLTRQDQKSKRIATPTKQASKPQPSRKADVTQPNAGVPKATTSALKCRKFLPGAGITISVACTK